MSTNKPELVYSRDEEVYSYDSVEEMVESMEDDGTSGSELVGVAYWVGEKTQKPASAYFSHMVSTVIEQAQDQAWQDADEYSTGFADEASTEAKEELQQLINSWADKHLKVNFFTVKNVHKELLNEDDVKHRHPA